MKSYILNLEKELSLIENGFKEQERRALADYKAKGAEYCKEIVPSIRLEALSSADVCGFSLWAPIR